MGTLVHVVGVTLHERTRHQMLKCAENQVRNVLRIGLPQGTASNCLSNRFGQCVNQSIMLVMKVGDVRLILTKT